LKNGSSKISADSQTNLAAGRPRHNPTALPPPTTTTTMATEYSCDTHGTDHVVMAAPRGCSINIYTVPTCSKCGIMCGEGVSSPGSEFVETSTLSGADTIKARVASFVNSSVVSPSGTVQTLGQTVGRDIPFTQGVIVSAAAHFMYDKDKMIPRAPMNAPSFAAAICGVSITNTGMPVVFPADFAGFVGATAAQCDELQRMKVAKMTGFGKDDPLFQGRVRSIEAAKKSGTEMEAILTQLVNPHIETVPKCVRVYMNTFMGKTGKPLYDCLFEPNIEKGVISPSMVVYLSSGMRLMERFFGYAYDGKNGVDWCSDHLVKVQKNFLSYALRTLMSDNKKSKVNTVEVRTRKRRMWRHAAALAYEFFNGYMRSIHSVCASMSKSINPDYTPDDAMSGVWHSIVNVPFPKIMEPWANFRMADCTKCNASDIRKLCKENVLTTFMDSMESRVKEMSRGPATKADLAALRSMLEAPPEPEPVKSEMIALQPMRVQVQSSALGLEGRNRTIIVEKGEDLYEQALEVHEQARVTKIQMQKEYTGAYNSLIAMRIPANPDATDEDKRKRDTHAKVVAEFRKEEHDTRQEIKELRTHKGKSDRLVALQAKMQAMHAVRRGVSSVTISRKTKRKRSNAEQDRKDDDRDDERMKKKADVVHAEESTHTREKLVQQVKRRRTASTRPSRFKSPALKAMQMARRRNAERNLKMIEAIQNDEVVGATEDTEMGQDPWVERPDDAEEPDFVGESEYQGYRDEEEY